MSVQETVDRIRAHFEATGACPRGAMDDLSAEDRVTVWSRLTHIDNLPLAKACHAAYVDKVLDAFGLKF